MFQINSTTYRLVPTNNALLFLRASFSPLAAPFALGFLVQRYFHLITEFLLSSQGTAVATFIFHNLRKTPGFCF